MNELTAYLILVGALKHLSDWRGTQSSHVAQACDLLRERANTLAYHAKSLYSDDENFISSLEREARG